MPIVEFRCGREVSDLSKGWRIEFHNHDKWMLSFLASYQDGRTSLEDVFELWKKHVVPKPDVLRIYRFHHQESGEIFPSHLCVPGGLAARECTTYGHQACHCGRPFGHKPNLKDASDVGVNWTYGVCGCLCHWNRSGYIGKIENVKWITTNTPDMTSTLDKLGQK